MADDKGDEIQGDVVDLGGGDLEAGTTRRGLIKKGLIGAGVAGAVWVGPKVEGLSVRPDYAAAQSFSFGTPVFPPGAYTITMPPPTLVGPLYESRATTRVPLGSVGSGFPGTFFDIDAAWVQNAPGPLTAPLVGTLTLTKGTSPHPPDDCGFILLSPTLNNIFTGTVGSVTGTISVTSGQIVGNLATITTLGSPISMLVTGYVGCL